MQSSYPTNSATCIACEGKKWRVCPTTTRVIRSVFDHSNVLRCQRCGQGVLDPLPSQAVLDAIYSSSEYLNAYEEVGTEFPTSGAEQLKTLAPRFQLLERCLPEKGVLLDVGASRGFFLSEARKLGWACKGLEAGPDAVRFAKEILDIEIQLGTIESIDWPESSVDCIHLSHVLEHLLNPAEALLKLKQVIRPGGIFAIEVPYEFGDLFDRVRETLLRRQRVPYEVRSTHLHFFSLKSLSLLLERLGLEVIAGSTPRRNRSETSRYPLGKFAKSAVYSIESTLHWGPLVEVYARRKP